MSVTDLHRLVIGKNCRIELADGNGGVCILISKSELDALEQALEILSDTNECRAMREQLTQLVSTVAA